MIKLFIVIIYMNLPADIHQLEWWGPATECHKIGNMIVQDVISSPLITHVEYYCAGAGHD